MISKDKTYTTRDGREVRIYATDGTGPFPVHAALKCNDEWEYVKYTRSGHYVIADKIDHPLDLIEAPVTRQMWANVYNNVVHMHDTQEEAIRGYTNAHRKPDPTLIACVPVTIVYRPGEGL